MYTQSNQFLHYYNIYYNYYKTVIICAKIANEMLTRF